MFGDLDGHHGVTRLAAQGTWLALPLEADLLAILDSRRDRDLQGPAGRQGDASGRPFRRLGETYCHVHTVILATRKRRALATRPTPTATCRPGPKKVGENIARIQSLRAG